MPQLLAAPIIREHFVGRASLGLKAVATYVAGFTAISEVATRGHSPEFKPWTS